MVRFKVIRGSHLMLVLSALILAAVVIFILLQSSPEEAKTQPYFLSNAQTEATEEAKVAETFASSVSAQPLQIEIETDKPNAPPLQDAPSVLVYHTHTHEAYEQTASDIYDSIESWRTADASHSVVRVGAALAEALEKQGFFVFHDTTDHELDDLDKSYVRSLETLESYSREFDLIIDLHRDAYIEGMPLSLKSGNETYAQLMMLVGNGGNYTGSEAPNYENNLAFAQKLTNELNQRCSGIARNVTIKNGRFNQHIGKTAVLIEVGHNRNTLPEALRSIPVLSQSIASILR